MGDKRSGGDYRPGRAEILQRSMRAICHERKVVVHAIGIMPEHVHLAAFIPPSLSVSTVVKELKGESSLLVNRTGGEGTAERFAWQGEYGVISFGERSLPTIVSYLENQETHHATDDLFPAFELIDRPEFARKPVLSPGGTS